MLLTLDEAAAEMRIPKGSLRRAAEQHGLLVRIGRAVRIDPATIPELIEKCRLAPKDRASIGTNLAQSGSSATPGALKQRRAQQTAQMLKRPSLSTSQGATGQLVPLRQRK